MPPKNYIYGPAGGDALQTSITAIAADIAASRIRSALMVGAEAMWAKRKVKKEVLELA